MSLLRKLPSAIAACGLTLAAGVALAQNAPAPTAPAGSGQAHWAQHRAEMRQHFEHMRAEHLQTLHDALSIRPDQEGAWQAFVTATAPQPHEHRAQGGAAGSGGEHHLTTPERLDRMEKRMEERHAAFQRHAEAVKALYAALSPTQQKTFDALAKLHGFGHHGGGFGHHGFGGRGGPGMKPGMGPGGMPPAGE